MVVKGAAGVYVVGTGRVGVAETFFTLGIGYFLVMVMQRFRIGCLRRAGCRLADAARGDFAVDDHSTRRQCGPGDQDAAVLSAVDCAVLQRDCGIGVLGVAKTMISEIFGRRCRRS
jgi:hypothetical protein